MNCKEYTDMEPLEKSIFIGKVIHAIQNDSKLFKWGLALTKMAEEKGLFDKVVFHPDIIKTELEHETATN